LHTSRRVPVVAFSLLVLVVFGSLPSCGRHEEVEEVGIRSAILITIDTLRADHLSSYGYWRETSPALDRFFERGARFEYAFSTSPKTAPSHVSILTGLYPDFTSVGTENRKYDLLEETTTLAELCQRAGMKTAAIVSNFVLDGGLGLSQGFDSYDDRMEDRERNRDLPEQIAENTLRKALAKLDELQGESFFLWVHFQDPHGPYDPPEPWETKFPDGDRNGNPGETLRAGFAQDGLGSIPKYQIYDEERRVDQYVRRYDGEIAYLDSRLAELFARLDASGLLASTLVVVTADHGEAMGEDSYYFAHGQSLATDQTRVPLAFVGPQVVPSQVLRFPVSNITIFATILNALGLADSPTVEQSESLWGLLRGETIPEMPVGFGSSNHEDMAVEGDLYLRARHIGSRAASGGRTPGGRQLAGETLDRLEGEGDVDPARVDALRGKLQEFGVRSREAIQEIAPRRGRPRTMTAEEEAKLRALGYMK